MPRWLGITTAPTTVALLLFPPLCLPLPLLPLNANVSSSTSSLPTFQPPAPGQLLIAQATITMGEYKRSIPVLYYTSKDSTHKYVYPFTRSLIGTVWHTPEQLERCEFHHIHEPDAIKFCARRADLPVEMIQQLLVALEQNGGRANLDTAKLASWHADLRNPEGRFTTGIPCTQCGLLNHVHLCDVIHLHDISNGMACKHIGKDCIQDELHIHPSTKPSNIRTTQPPASATIKTEHEPVSHSSSSSSSHPMNRTWPHMQHAPFMNYPYQFPNMMPMHPPNADFHTHTRMPQQPTLVDPRSRANVPSFTHLSPDAWNHLEAMNHPPYPPMMNHHSFGNPYMNAPYPWPTTYATPSASSTNNPSQCLLPSLESQSNKSARTTSISRPRFCLPTTNTFWLLPRSSSQ